MGYFGIGILFGIGITRPQPERKTVKSAINRKSTMPFVLNMLDYYIMGDAHYE